MNGDAHQCLDKTGYCMTLGHHPGTGLGGLVQQGGHGPLEKVMGLSVDAMVSATLVTATGELTTCSLDENADLFWAVRGGCGNFGVVTAFRFKLVKYDQVMPALTRVHLPIPYVMPSRYDVITAFRDTCEANLPDTISPLSIAPSSSASKRDGSTAVERDDCQRGRVLRTVRTRYRTVG